MNSASVFFSYELLPSTSESQKFPKVRFSKVNYFLLSMYLTNEMNSKTLIIFLTGLYISIQSWFWKHWNSQKSLCNIWYRFWYVLDEWIEKICKFFEMHMDRPDKSKIFFEYDNNCLSIWTFMCHPWFSTRNASKTFKHLFLFILLVK